MKLLKRLKEGVELSPDSVEDLLVLSKLVSPGDLVSGTSFRRFKTQDLTRGSSGEKKKIRVTLRVEKVDFAEAANALRFTGVITAGTPEEYVQAGEHHTLEVAPREFLRLEKELDAFERGLLDEAVKKRKRVKAALCVMDEHKALVALLSDKVRFVCEIDSFASKRDPKGFDKARSEFFGELATVLEGQAADAILVAGPGFAKDEFKKWLADKHRTLSARVAYGHASTAEKSGVFELVKSGGVDAVLEDRKLAEDFEAVQEFMKRLSKNGAVRYGIDSVREAMDARAVESLLFLDSLFKRGNPHYREALALANEARKAGASVRILDSESEAGLEFESFQVGALLRYKL
ncbi:MAG: mRNA surveillance protein pelota [Candidatus Micrarchaeia archaeon]